MPMVCKELKILHELLRSSLLSILNNHLFSVHIATQRVPEESFGFSPPSPSMQQYQVTAPQQYGRGPESPFKTGQHHRYYTLRNGIGNINFREGTPCSLMCVI